MVASGSRHQKIGARPSLNRFVPASSCSELLASNGYASRGAELTWSSRPPLRFATVPQLEFYAGNEAAGLGCRRVLRWMGSMRIVALMVAIATAITSSGAASARSPQMSTSVSNQTPCQFVLGFADLREQVGPEIVGDCLEDQHFAPQAMPNSRLLAVFWLGLRPTIEPSLPTATGPGRLGLMGWKSLSIKTIQRTQDVLLRLLRPQPHLPHPPCRHRCHPPVRGRWSPRISRR